MRRDGTSHTIVLRVSDLLIEDVQISVACAQATKDWSPSCNPLHRLAALVLASMLVESGRKRKGKR